MSSVPADINAQRDLIPHLFALSVQYPTEEIHIRICNGLCEVGIPKGPLGDEMTAVWDRILTKMSVSAN